jgi:hypothetical protein
MGNVTLSCAEIDMNLVLLKQEIYMNLPEVILRHKAC